MVRRPADSSAQDSGPKALWNETGNRRVRLPRLSRQNGEQQNSNRGQDNRRCSSQFCKPCRVNRRATACRKLARCFFPIARSRRSAGTRRSRPCSLPGSWIRKLRTGTCAVDCALVIRFLATTIAGAAAAIPASADPGARDRPTEEHQRIRER
jgi:hypothetical protein